MTIPDLRPYLNGTLPLPAGAVPLAADGPVLVCLLPSGEWASWYKGVMTPRHPLTQKEVVDALVAALGGTAAKAAERLDISPRTIEAWRMCKEKISARTAYRLFYRTIAQSQ